MTRAPIRTKPILALAGAALLMAAASALLDWMGPAALETTPGRLADLIATWGGFLAATALLIVLLVTMLRRIYENLQTIGRAPRRSPDS